VPGRRGARRAEVDRSTAPPFLSLSPSILSYLALAAILFLFLLLLVTQL